MRGNYNWTELRDFADNELASGVSEFLNVYLPRITLLSVYTSGARDGGAEIALDLYWFNQNGCSHITVNTRDKNGRLLISDHYKLLSRDGLHHVDRKRLVLASAYMFEETNKRFGSAINVTWQQLYAVCTSCLATGEEFPEKLCSLIGGRPICKSCMDRYSLAPPAPSQISATKPTPEEIERRKLTPSLRYDVLENGNFTCVTCGSTSKDGAKLHVDHIVPISKGGKTEPGNLQVLCEKCNLGKSNKIPSQPSLDFMQELQIG